MKTKPIFLFLLVVAGVTGLGFIAPWWAGALWVVVVTAIMKINKRQDIFMAAIAFALVWIAMARYMSMHDEGDIITKTGVLLGGLSHQLMMVATLVIAFITGLLSAWFGSALGKTFFSQKNEIISPEK